MKELKKTIKQVAQIDRSEVLRDQTRENKGQQTILISTWDPKINAIRSIKFHLISNDPKLSKKI